jgi:hypothetical protein
MRMRVQVWDACNNNTLKIKVYIRGFIFPNALNAALITKLHNAVFLPSGWGQRIGASDGR